MHPMAARAFLNRLLDSRQRGRLRVYERSLPPGRYLLGFEICRKFRLSAKEIPEREIDEMEALWTQYATTQLRSSEEFEERHPEIPERSKAEEVHAWEDWEFAHHWQPVAAA